MKRFLVMVMRTPRFDASLVEPHKAFLERLRGQGCLELSGPFTDASGGAYMMRAADLDAARALAFTDPLHVSGASIVSVHEWNAS